METITIINSRFVTTCYNVIGLKKMTDVNPSNEPTIAIKTGRKVVSDVNPSNEPTLGISVDRKSSNDRNVNSSERNIMFIDGNKYFDMSSEKYNILGTIHKYSDGQEIILIKGTKINGKNNEIHAIAILGIKDNNLIKVIYVPVNENEDISNSINEILEDYLNVSKDELQISEVDSEKIINGSNFKFGMNILEKISDVHFNSCSELNNYREALIKLNSPTTQSNVIENPRVMDQSNRNPNVVMNNMRNNNSNPNSVMNNMRNNNSNPNSVMNNMRNNNSNPIAVMNNMRNNNSNPNSVMNNMRNNNSNPIAVMNNMRNNNSNPIAVMNNMRNNNIDGEVSKNINI